LLLNSYARCWRFSDLEFLFGSLVRDLLANRLDLEANKKQFWHLNKINADGEKYI